MSWRTDAERWPVRIVRLCCCAVAGLAGVAAAADSRPNIIYVMTDDQGYGDIAKEHPEVVARLAAAYDAWWRSVQPDLVNENLDGPAENPFKTAYERQSDRTSATKPSLK